MNTLLDVVWDIEMLLSLFTLMSSALAYEVWTIPKMDCIGCDDIVEELVLEIEGIGIEEIAFSTGVICLEKLIEDATLYTRLEEHLNADGFFVTEKKQMDSCEKVKASLWHGVEGDFLVISSGERFSMRKNKVKGKYTLFDFGAIWCGPCQEYTKQLKPLLASNNQLAIRAIELGEDPVASFDFPVVFQHLSAAEGIPWFVLFDPTGTKIYEGNDLNAVIQLIE